MFGLAWLAPLILGGLAFLGLPWLIHQIRRPERDTVRFSSLMFLPSAHKRVIERRSVQHLLLMLLRMVLLLLLALAFARPSQMYLAATPSPAGAGAHMILLDTSYSMRCKAWIHSRRKTGSASSHFTER